MYYGVPEHNPGCPDTYPSMPFGTLPFLLEMTTVFLSFCFVWVLLCCVLHVLYIQREREILIGCRTCDGFVFGWHMYAVR